MDFAILGPLHVGSDGTDITPRAAKPRALLLRLLVDANRVVGAERLIDDLWDDDPPRSAAATLQGYVSQLRKALGADRLLTRAGGYELVVAAGELDAQAFEAEVGEGRRTGSVAHLQRALGRWRGAALVDAAGASWAVPEIARLEELRLVAVESYLDAQLASGDNVGVIAAAEAAIAEHPLRERLWALLMTALYRDGRQGDALRAFQRLRARLGDELGIEPSRELVDLEARMVRQEMEAPPAPKAPAPLTSGTLTFLFTDLESSTRLWDEHEDAMSAALASHDALLREVVERNDGRVMKTTGDGTYAVFVSAIAAVQAAVDAQLALEAQTWGATGPLRARIALHTGVAEQRDDDYFGPALNRAACLMGIAHGGQVLVSQATESMVRDSPGIELVDLGEHRLRDLSRPERVFQVVVPGQRSDFPPLRSLDALPTNLPVQLTTFIGRADALRRVPDLVHEHRAVTITGVGGVGKTRLALQAAGDLIGDFADGAWYCELAQATDEETMLGIVAAALNVPARSGMTLEESVIEFFRHKDLLLVLDNCEHLLDPAARLVDAILRASPGVRIIITSREALDVDGERILPLRSMGVASSDSLDAISESDAVQLFVDRAANARAGFVLDAANAATINTICRRLDGIPLAIELAAVRVVSMSPSEIAALLDERFRLLTGGRRIALERQQTLRATVEWSYDLLTEQERTVFDRLAVFAGSFDAMAARAIATDETVAAWDVIDALDGLVRKSLVIAEEQTDGGTRYQLLETLRQYARERLDDRDETDAWRARHAAHFAAFADDVRAGLLGPDEFAWRARREPELDNIRVAIAWAIDREDPALITSYVESSLDEAMVLWSKMGRPATRALPFADRFEPEARVSVYLLAAYEAYVLGDMETAHELTAEGELLATTLDFASVTSVVRTAFSPDLGHSPLRDTVIAMILESPGALEASDWTVAHQARVYSALGQYILQYRGDFELSQEFIDRARALALESRNPSTMCHVLFTYGSIYASLDPERALTAFNQCIEIGSQGSPWVTGAAYYVSALLLANRGDDLRAVTRLREAILFLYGRGRSPELDGAFGYVIEFMDHLGEPQHAAVVLGAVLGGVLQILKSMPVPPDRRVPTVQSLRDAVGADRFRELVALGAGMTHEELIAWTRNTLDDLERKLQP